MCLNLTFINAPAITRRFACYNAAIFKLASVLMNPDLQQLHAYPFEKLARIKQGLTPPAHLEHIALSIGEPQHSAPHFVVENLIAHLHQLSTYPSTKGSSGLRETIQAWLCQRFNLSSNSLAVDQNILPVSGTREALFALAQSVIDRTQSNPLVLMPNPFYQIYEGAAILAGAKPYYLNCIAENNFVPDLDQVSDQTWQDCQLIYICTPGNPTGAVMSQDYLQKLIGLAQKFDFIIASDECYSEIYFDENNPPPGLLGAAAQMGLDNYRRCIVFHSLSKRSNLPGLRSGFVAGDAAVIKLFLLYRTYHGSALAPATQTASATAWADEQHVIENRKLYREKFDAVLNILSATLAPVQPEAGFYIWLKTPMHDPEFAAQLYQQQNITVLPGRYLSRLIAGINPGENYVRMALVAPLDECKDAAQRINQLLQSSLKS